MNTLKRKNMMSSYDGHKGQVTVNAVMSQIPAELLNNLTGRELGLVMSAINQAYHSGKADAGAEIIDGQDVWVCDKMVPLEVIRNLNRTEAHIAKKVPFDGNLCSQYDYQSDNRSGKRKAWDLSSNVPRDQWHEWYYIEHETLEQWSLTKAN